MKDQGTAHSGWDREREATTEEKATVILADIAEPVQHIDELDCSLPSRKFDLDATSALSWRVAALFQMAKTMVVSRTGRANSNVRNDQHSGRSLLLRHIVSWVSYQPRIKRVAVAISATAPALERKVRAIIAPTTISTPSQPMIRNWPRAFSGRKIAIAGVFRTRCGLRRGAELMMCDFRNKGVEVFPIDISAPLDLPINTDYPGLLQPSDLVQLDVSDLIIHMNPPTFASALSLFPSDALEETSIIGYWAWELSVLSDDWRQCADFCDAIWVPSRFVAETVFREIPHFRGDLRVVPHAVDQDRMPQLDTASKLELRERLKIGIDQFVAGYSFAFDSNYTRKNCPAVIDAFRLAFPNSDTSVTLIIRCHDADKDARLFSHLKSYAGDDDRIQIYNVSKTPLPIVEFYAALDVYLALFRSEGYGLNLAEAAQVGVKVVATAWGLASDIAERPEVYPVDYRLVVPIDSQGFYDQFEDAVWAEPDICHAAYILKLLRNMKRP